MPVLARLEARSDDERRTTLKKEADRLFQTAQAE
jgi:hypothetical protein